MSWFSCVCVVYHLCVLCIIFVRVVYHFWADDTSPIFSDSCFVAGNSIIYLNGVISDASIEPAETATFELNINLPDSLNIEYITKETSWSLFD